VFAVCFFISQKQATQEEQEISRTSALVYKRNWRHSTSCNISPSLNVSSPMQEVVLSSPSCALYRKWEVILKSRAEITEEFDV
jgi:hypothetical protein